MDLNEARRVLWIRPNRKPLGELLDEGLLSKGQLEWAAAHAFNPKLQEAAKVLLPLFEKSNSTAQIENKRVRLDVPRLNIPITVDQARITVWPLPPYKGEPMGMLFQEKKLSLKDLGYAIENAWDQKVRNAALVLSAIRMEQIVQEPPPPKGHISVLSKGKSFSARRILQITQVRGLVLGFILGIASLWFFNVLFGRHQTQSSLTIGEILASPTGVIGLIIGLAIIIGAMIFILFAVDRTVKELDDLAVLFRKGAEGE